MERKTVIEIRARSRHILLTAVTIFALMEGVGASQERTHGPFWNERAHRHNNDMSCCAPCAPEANQDPDVFRRPCFLRALSKSRKGIEASSGLMFSDGIDVPAGQTAAARLEGFRTLLSSLLQPAFLPQAWDGVKFYVPYPPMKAVVELRSGVKTFVGYEPDRATGVVELEEGDAIQAAWTVEGIEVLPRMRYSEKQRTNKIEIRLRLYGDERLELRWRSKHKEVLFGSGEWEQWVFVDKLAFHQFLGKVFRVPFQTPDDFVFDGYDTEHKGVSVFHGTIVSREQGRVWVGGEDPPQRILITDSDPQYVCLSFDLNEPGNSEHTEP